MNIIRLRYIRVGMTTVEDKQPDLVKLRKAAYRRIKKEKQYGDGFIKLLNTIKDDNIQIRYLMDISSTHTFVACCAHGITPRDIPPLWDFKTREMYSQMSYSLSAVDNAFNAAAKYGHLHVMKWLFEKNKPNDMTIYNAAIYGNLDNIKWLVEVADCKISKPAFIELIKHGNLVTMDWCLRRADWFPFKSDSSHDYYNIRVCAMHTAAHIGDIISMIWLKAEGFTFDESVFAAAAQSGNRRVLEWVIRE